MFVLAADTVSPHYLDYLTGSYWPLTALSYAIIQSAGRLLDQLPLAAPEGRASRERASCTSASYSPANSRRWYEKAANS